jgi:hypothetical protein
LAPQGKDDLATRDELFEVTSSRQLSEFYARLHDKNSSFNSALKFLVQSWIDEISVGETSNFDPRAVLADDMSAAILGKYPIIFMGTNAWATKPYLDLAAHRSKSLTRIGSMKPIH